MKWYRDSADHEVMKCSLLPMHGNYLTSNIHKLRHELNAVNLDFAFSPFSECPVAIIDDHDDNLKALKLNKGLNKKHEKHN